MARPELTVINVVASLLSQNFIPRSVIYSGSDVGTVEVVIYNIQAGSPDPDGNPYPGEPMVRYEARCLGLRAFNTEQGESVRVFDNLPAALNYIGVY